MTTLHEELLTRHVKRNGSICIDERYFQDMLAHARGLELEMPNDCDMMFVKGDQIIRIRHNADGNIEILVNDELRMTLI